MRKIFYILLLYVFMSAPVFGDEIFDRLMNAKSLKCKFGPSAFADWKGSKVKVRKDKFDATVTYDSIDLKTGKARMTADAGAADVIVLASADGLTFIEETTLGNFSFTTVFADYAKGTLDFIVVTSRHEKFINEPLPSQYHGTCKILE